ncbi:polyphosphate kinase 2 [Olivibacter sitiensis]|uniref:polyphosphate kinase 2 n=1 Tax=Olivibacter sitiensis TaxID=376470 RepID=UPI0003F91529|nr:polyphosphate kinase 2 [Olivibacter sitiensis]
MAVFDLKDLESIVYSDDILSLLVKKGIIKEQKLREQLAYEKDLHALQFELLRLQTHIINANARLLVIVEGRDAAGKGGTISRAIAKMNPKKYRVVALPKPTENEQKQWYFQRYIKHLPQEGEVVFFDRSWYNRAVVEPVFGFCSKEQHKAFMKQVGDVEKLLVKEGIVLMKIFLDISKPEQEKRLRERAEDPEKSWKIGGLDEQALEKWDDYSYYIDRMLNKTSSKDAPWIRITADDKKKTRIQVMNYILGHFPGFKPKTKVQVDKTIFKKID